MRLCSSHMRTRFMRSRYRCAKAMVSLWHFVKQPVCITIFDTKSREDIDAVNGLLDALTCITFKLRLDEFNTPEWLTYIRASYAIRAQLTKLWQHDLDYRGDKREVCNLRDALNQYCNKSVEHRPTMQTLVLEALVKARYAVEHIEAGDLEGGCLDRILIYKNLLTALVPFNPNHNPNPSPDYDTDSD